MTATPASDILRTLLLRTPPRVHAAEDSGLWRFDAADEMDGLFSLPATAYDRPMIGANTMSMIYRRISVEYPHNGHAAALAGR